MRCDGHRSTCAQFRYPASPILLLALILVSKHLFCHCLFLLYADRFQSPACARSSAMPSTISTCTHFQLHLFQRPHLGLNSRKAGMGARAFALRIAASARSATQSWVRAVMWAARSALRGSKVYKNGEGPSKKGTVGGGGQVGSQVCMTARVVMIYGVWSKDAQAAGPSGHVGGKARPVWQQRVEMSDGTRRDTWGTVRQRS